MTEIRQQMRFSAGNVIIEEDPYAYSLDPDLVQIMCSYCMRKRPLTTCPRCGVIKYCNPECEMKDRAYHDLECKVLQSFKNASIPDEEVRLVLRMLDRCIRERREGSDAVGDFFGYRRTIHDLQSHSKDLNASKREKAVKRANSIVGLVKGHVSTSTEQVLDILLKCRINRTTLIDHNSRRFYSCGSALYLGVSKMNHSCVEAPYVAIFNGRKFTLRALRDVQIDDPLTLTVHYVPPNMPFSQRQRHLLHNFYFICNCAKCCFQARHPVPEADEAVVARIEKSFQTAPDYNMWYSAGRELLAKLKHLPDSNFYVNWLLIHMQSTCAMLGRLEESVHYGTRALRSTETVTTIETVVYSMCDSLVKLGWHKPDSSKEGAFIEAIRLAKELFILTHGADHKLYRSLERMQRAREEMLAFAHQAGDFGRSPVSYSASDISQAIRSRYPIGQPFAGAMQAPPLWMNYHPQPLVPAVASRYRRIAAGPWAIGVIPRSPSVGLSPRFSVNPVGGRATPIR